jgi:hypothetical protein
LLGVVLDIGRRDRRNGGSEGAQVEIGGAVGVQGVNVDGPPVDVGHGGWWVVGDSGARRSWLQRDGSWLSWWWWWQWSYAEVQCHVSTLPAKLRSYPVQRPQRLAKHPPCSTSQGRRAIPPACGSLRPIDMPETEIRSATCVTGAPLGWESSTMQSGYRYRRVASRDLDHRVQSKLSGRC